MLHQNSIMNDGAQAVQTALGRRLPSMPLTQLKTQESLGGTSMVVSGNGIGQHECCLGGSETHQDLVVNVPLHRSG
jgi:hypothetical protein